MKAQVIDAFGGPEKFRLAELPDPTPAPEEVVVRVEAASVNPIDYKIRANGPPIAPDLPAVLGCDFAGTVTAVGAAVSGFAPGDRVYGCAGGVKGVSGGAYAEQIAADAALLAPMPAGLSAREAAALPLVAITAWEGLVDRARVEAGQTVLIRGGAGGVGHVAIQIAKARGAVVTATVSSDEKAEIARAFGADHVIDYTREDMAARTRDITDGKGFQIVFDATGGGDFDTAFAAGGLHAQIITIVARKPVELTPMYVKGQSLHAVYMPIAMLHGIGRAHQGEILRQVARMVEEGTLRPLIDPHRFDLASLADAHRLAENGRPLGKVVIDV